MENDVLTSETIKKAMEKSSGLPPPYDPLILHPKSWDDYKLLFRLTDEQMNRYFVKSTYLFGEDGEMREKILIYRHIFGWYILLVSKRTQYRREYLLRVWRKR